MKRAIKFTSMLIVASIITTLFSGFTNQNEAIETTKIIRDEKILCTATLDQDFDDNSILVVMDNVTGGVNKEHDISFLEILASHPLKI